MPIPVRVAAVFFSLFAGAGLVRLEPSPESAAAQVWSGEEAYWGYVQAHNVEHFVALWSDNFVGWPMVKDHPIHKEEVVSDFKSGNSPLSRVVAYELQRESVEMHGSIGITFYRATTHYRNADGSESTTTRRLSHTWMKNGQVWQIVAGMSAAEPTNSTKP
ncbi:MAG: hypothetical protein DMG38_24555 [Acidobacteria bacterium]|nr:MAG: hypothetical protein DMG38_24555 [Acidobacteriota bacterium]